MFVTYEFLIQFVSMLVALVTLCYLVFKGKKED